MENAMLANLTASACLARADDLTDLADRAHCYDLIHLYEDLAQEWRLLASLIVTAKPASHEPLRSIAAGSAARRYRLHFRFG